MPAQTAPNVESLQKEVVYRKRLTEITNLFNSAPSLNHILVNLKDKVLELVGAERVTIFAIDTKNQELYSLQKSGSDIKEIRVPKTFGSLAGFAALSRQTLRIVNAYDAAELAKVHPHLKFDARWDKTSGYKTKQVLATPILFEKYLIGVLELINKVNGPGFTEQDHEAAEEIARMLGVAFYNQNRAARQNKPGKFGLLVDKGILSEKDIEAAAATARVNNTDVAIVLLEKHKIPKEEIGAALSQFYRLPFFQYTGGEKIPEELKQRVPFDFLKKNVVAPIERKGTTLVVAIDDPLDLVRLDGFKALGIAPNYEVHVALKDDLMAYLHTSYGQPMEVTGAAADLGRLLVELGEGEHETTEEETREEEVDETDSGIVRLANQIVVDAYNRGASDIHIEPNGAQLPTIVRFRVDGDCTKYMELPGAHRNALVQRFKIMAQLDISERRKPQDGKIRFKTPQLVIELRVATIPTSGNNEDVVMRILAASKPQPLEKMGMSERNLAEFKKIMAKPYGIVLCVGPTGSGKTTTLHSALGYINTPDLKIWTAEDPVEITQFGLRQVQVHAKIDFTFAAAMRSFLRADPDVIMVGEMRDQETAQIGVEASLTGHLVLSTLHTNSAPETIVRLLDMDIDPFNFADSLLGILAQRLARTICPGCKEPYHPEQIEYDEMREAYGPGAFDSLAGPYTPEFSLQRGKGCRECLDTGYKGRIALHELLVGSDQVKRLIQRRASVEEVRNQGVSEGMTTLLQDGIEKVLKGLTDFKQVRAVCIK